MQWTETLFCPRIPSVPFKKFLSSTRWWNLRDIPRMSAWKLERKHFWFLPPLLLPLDGKEQSRGWKAAFKFFLRVLFPASRERNVEGGGATASRFLTSGRSLERQKCKSGFQSVCQHAHEEESHCEMVQWPLTLFNWCGCWWTVLTWKQKPVWSAVRQIWHQERTFYLCRPFHYKWTQWTLHLSAYSNKGRVQRNMKKEIPDTRKKKPPTHGNKPQTCSDTYAH